MARKESKPKARSSLASALGPGLVPAPAARVKVRLAELKAAAGGGKGLKLLFKDDARTDSFVGSVLEYSPFLRSLALDDPARLDAFLAGDPAATFARIVAETQAAWRGTSEAELAATLRRRRADVALLTALADLGGVWDVIAVTEALSRFAETAVASAANFLLGEAHGAGDLILPDPARPAEGSGWIILAMGKFGAGELNYSSDIDLIVLYDEEGASLPPEKDPGRLFVRLTKKLVQILGERTADGYVFRTDLRLRPDPASTNIALSVGAALQ
jgi:glutamate-ammonia-ligase adenylyltransferase